MTWVTELLYVQPEKSEDKTYCDRGRSHLREGGGSNEAMLSELSQLCLKLLLMPSTPWEYIHAIH